MRITRASHPLTWDCFAQWFDREGWGADSIESLSDEGWADWFPTFRADWDYLSPDEIEAYLSKPK